MAKFMKAINIEPNNALYSDNLNSDYLSYGVKYEFGERPSSPLFVLPISSVSHINTKAIRYALFDAVTHTKENLAQEN